MPLAVCATPIGNLDDVTLRVLDELRAAAVVLAEDTRHTRGLLDRHGIQAPGSEPAESILTKVGQGIGAESATTPAAPSDIKKQ